MKTHGVLFIEDTKNDIKETTVNKDGDIPVIASTSQIEQDGELTKEEDYSSASVSDPGNDKVDYRVADSSYFHQQSRNLYIKKLDKKQRNKIGKSLVGIAASPKFSVENKAAQPLRIKNYEKIVSINDLLVHAETAGKEEPHIEIKPTSWIDEWGKGKNAEELREDAGNAENSRQGITHHNQVWKADIENEKIIKEKETVKHDYAPPESVKAETEKIKPDKQIIQTEKTEKETTKKENQAPDSLKAENKKEGNRSLYTLIIGGDITVKIAIGLIAGFLGFSLIFTQLGLIK